MASSGMSLVPTARTEDVLEQLPISRTTEYAKGRVIYGPDNPSNYVYLVVSGKVTTSRTAADGTQVLLEIILPDEIFGESSFLNMPHRPERAIALESSKVMKWAVSDFEDLVSKRPRLSVALLQIFAQRNADSASRIESFATDNIEQRLARSLLHFSARLGTVEAGGAEHMMPFTHLFLSQYIGTTREIVTQHMNRLRNRGFISYSRLGIQLYRENLTAVLEAGPSPSTAHQKSQGSIYENQT
jgi:CRP-like cAMP-binding protein